MASIQKEDLLHQSLSVLISNMVFCTRMDGMEARQIYMQEIDRRYPIPPNALKPETAASALDAVQVDKVVNEEAQNFDVIPEVPTESGYYLAQFVGPVEVVYYNHDRKIVLRIDGTLSFDNTKQQHKVHEFKWLQKVMFHPGLDFNCQPNLPEDAQPPLTISCDFKRTWDRLSFVHDRLVHVYGDNVNIDFLHALREVRDMFQNPAIIKSDDL